MKSKVKITAQINFIFDFSFKFQCNMMIKCDLKLRWWFKFTLATTGHHTPGYLLTNIHLKKIYYADYLMTRCLGQKKIRKILLQIKSSYFSQMVLHNGRNKLGL